MSIQSKAAPVRFEQVSKKYGKDVVAVDAIDLHVDAGKLVTLLGPSGCGKTTTLRMIAGLEMATSGKITIGDLDVTTLPATDRDVSMVFQSYALFPHMSVLENVTYGLTFSGFAKDEARSRALHGLDLVGLKGFDSRLPSELSGGQQQRVAVARALVLEPQVLLFDEPLSNLDAKLRRQVREDIRAIQQDLGLTVVYVTHDQEEALAVSDEIVVMRNAAIAQMGTPRNLYDAPNDRFVADFIGEANLLSCEIIAVDGDTATIEIEGYQHALPSRGLGRGPATIAVRPSRLVVGADAGIFAKVAKSTYVGVRMEYTLTGAFGQVFAVHDDVEAPLEPGAEVCMGFAAKGPVLLPE
ncbi:ABC transporter ATP-binding protein [uncultured Tateyamaria sp.]|uniref:ABC transporter ATP-binding protein n=1 Tax=uncultured Tateyamaria sp. TaxID=455651 RepID=UPI00261C68CC|nr:ABC transporter ATP-binding protein [uncultured Tateyamaria sp.]